MLPKEQVKSLLAESLTQFQSLPTLLRLPIPSHSDSSFTIFGDTHGQFMDLAHILSDDVAGFPSDTRQFLFNGDQFSYLLVYLFSLTRSFTR